jgi:hypothetical protein
MWISTPVCRPFQIGKVERDQLTAAHGRSEPDQQDCPITQLAQ